MNNHYIKGISCKQQSWIRKESDSMAAKFDEDTTVVDGVVRWKSNNLVPPADVLKFWNYIGKDFDIEKSNLIRGELSRKRLEKYKKSQENKKYTGEELFEMKAAFGEGAVVFNVVTGREITL